MPVQCKISSKMVCPALVLANLIIEEPPVSLTCPKIYLRPGDWCRFRTDSLGILGSSGLGRVGSSDMHLQEVPDDVPGSVGRNDVVTPWCTMVLQIYYFSLENIVES